MNLRLTNLQKKLCNELQNGLLICQRPFKHLAKFLNTNEKTILQQTHKLKELGIIRRIYPLINYRTLGMKSTLVAAHIPKENLKEVVKAVNSLENVSHNYRRAHYYNLWFTLLAKSDRQIKKTVSELSERFGIDFHSLPAVRTFKLDVRFDAEGKGGLLSQKGKQIPNDQIVQLNEKQKLILSKLQRDLDITARPFDFLCSKELENKVVLRVLKELIDKGVIKRIAAVIDHHKLGFVANVLFVCKVPQDKISQVGKKLAQSATVSHCYQRKTFENWPYILFAMMHAKNLGDIQRLIDKFVETENIDSFELLPTTEELKKQPLKYRSF